LPASAAGQSLPVSAGNKRTAAAFRPGIAGMKHACLEHDPVSFVRIMLVFF